MRTVLSAAASTDGRAVGVAFLVRRGATGVAASSAGLSASQQGDASGSAAAPDPEGERRRFEAAFTAAKAELSALSQGNTAGADVFAAHLEMAEDPMLEEQVVAALEAGKTAPEAVDAASEAICAMFREIEDEYLLSRVDDVRDVCRRIRDILTGAADPFAHLPEGAVVVAEELAPSDTARMDLSRVRAFVTARGSITSHVCIIARSKGIPALLGVDIASIPSGASLLVNADARTLIIDPAPADLAAVSAPDCMDAAPAAVAAPDRIDTAPAAPTAVSAPDRIDIAAEAARLSAGLREVNWPFRPETGRSGPAQAATEVQIYGNAGGLDDVRAALDAGADGIGLFRSEFLFLRGNALPTEDEQFAVYRDAVLLCAGKPLTIRTLDIGGDKALPYMNLPREENPFLGYRALRICLDRPEALFKPQLRAILRASAYGPVRLLLPMVISVDELRAVRALLAECMRELDAKAAGDGTAKRLYDPALPVGVMIETPAAVLLADQLSREADFFSIGTNDLTQYTLAADRGNPAVASLYDSLHPAVLRAIALTLAGARGDALDASGCASKGECAGHGAPPGPALDRSVPVCVCGEMAADPVAAQVLLSLGVDSLSLSSPSRIRAWKNWLRTQGARNGFGEVFCGE